MKKLLGLILSVLITSTAFAQTVAQDLAGLGMPPEQADYLASILPAGSVVGNNTWIKGRNAANSADINILKITTGDDTMLNADSGDVIQFAVAATPVAGISTTGELEILAGETLPAAVTNYASTTRSVAYVATDATSGPAINLLGNQATGTGGELNFLFTKATDLGAGTTVASGNQVGAIKFAGADGTTYVDAAAIYAFVDGTVGTNDMPGRLMFYTTPDGSATLAERFRIDNTGDLISNSSTGGNLVFNRTTKGLTMTSGTLAATGSVQGDAAAIADRVTTVTGADATKGVILPATPVNGDLYVVLNTAAAVLKIYPGSGDAINATAANTAVSVAASVPTWCIAVSASQWWCFEGVAP